MSTALRGGGVVATTERPVQKGSASSSTLSSSAVAAAAAAAKKGKFVKKMKKVVRKTSATKMTRGNDGSPTSNARERGTTVVSTGETMPSIFRIPSEEKYDRYAAALAVTEGLRRVRDVEIAHAEGSGVGRKRWGTKPSEDAPSQAAAKKRRAESAFLLQSTKAVKSLGMTVAQFNQIGREVITNPVLRERVSEQAYLYRVASAVNLEKVPLLDDPSSRELLGSSEHKKYRVQLFARSVHEIEDLRADQMEALRQSLQVERFPPGFDLSDPNVQPLLHPEVRRVCEIFPVKAEEIVKRYGLDSDEFNRMLEETRGNPIFRWRVQKYVEKAEEEKVKASKSMG